MEFTRPYLPMEWEEQWRKEKERRRRAIEEGGEEVEADDRKLRWIVAYNNQRMGMALHEKKEKSQVKKRNDSPSNQGEATEEGSDEQSKGQGYEEKIFTYCRPTFPREVFKSLEQLRDSSLLTDLTLITQDGQCLQAHSPVLAAVSSLVHQRLLTWDEEMERRERRDVDVQPEISISLGPEVGIEGLAGVLEFAYTGTIAALNRDKLPKIQSAATTLGVPRVLELCCEKEEKMKKCVWKAENKVSVDYQMKLSLQSIRQLWNERLGCDVELEVAGTSFRVHRVLLAASSDYFRAMFTSGMKESQQPCVVLPSLDASELKALIGCCYSGSLALSWGRVFEITCTSLQLQFQLALSLCLDFMVQEMETNSCLDVASFAEAYGMPELLEEAEDFILRNFQGVSTTLKFLDLPANKLLDLLRCDGLCAPSELAVFRAVVAWLEADPTERLAQAKEVMTGVRFSLMTFKEFREVRAINLRLECSSDTEIDLYSSALKDFGFSLPETKDQCRIRRPKYALVLVGGDQVVPDVGNRLPSRELWFANSLRSGTGLVKSMEWMVLGEIPEKPRFRHGVGVMGGQLYVVGGCEFYVRGDMLKSTYRYDPMQDKWQRLADMQEYRSNFTVVVRENCLYAIGGDTDITLNLGSVEVYSPDSDTWRFAKPLDHALSGHAATVWDGEIFISGGFNSTYQCLTSMFTYHPERGTTYLAEMSGDRAQHCMEVLRSCGGLCVVGGVCKQRTFYADQLACEVYDPLSDAWSAFTPLDVPHVGAASVVLEEKLYILGGYCQEDYRETRLVHRYDPAHWHWENMGKMPGPNTDIRACLLLLPEHLRH
ncbi:kelch-like protein 33 [Esox lucius]|uniref:kelch-like protein 33 n=1 Tax=Esox lucius TaxID=8010 RepID=UPI001477372D|nr:kelch-like protein 33 [Esox lucius]XP_019898757.2 kelch-like protein 33 [Esox lucius]XP_019898758.2 kelch-like protein 33 [Esox lucius]XP_028973846.2 kelch-like protein 33 [Esox lucius]